ncbi:MAG TPA: DUF3365 domain-containing protein [Acidobacteriota bacterium]|nr:DUF3365 domain-containing protein [Acidobacteriota bacterium]
MLRYALLCFFAGLLAGCTAESDKQAGETEPATAGAQFSQDTILYHDAAEKLIADFSRELKGELMAALSSGDAVDAIAVCRNMAPEIASRYATGNWSIRRVSDRNRNPNNRADTMQAVILSRFADTSAAPYMESWTIADSVSIYRFYKPIRTVPLCLKCHGDVQTLAPGVFEALKRQYPLDKATGYRSDELRGMFVVQATWPDGRAFAEQILTDSLEFLLPDTQ